jgi:hypothetical protein
MDPRRAGQEKAGPDDRGRQIASAVAAVLDSDDPAVERLMAALVGVIRGLPEPPRSAHDDTSISEATASGASKEHAV